MAIFKDVLYALSSAIETRLQRELSNILNANGAVEVTLDKATHVLTPSTDFMGKDQISETCVLVTPFWLERAMILGEMQE